MELEGGGYEDEGNVEYFGRHAGRVRQLAIGMRRRYLPIANYSDIVAFACHNEVLLLIAVLGWGN